VVVWWLSQGPHQAPSSKKNQKKKKKKETKMWMRVVVVARWMMMMPEKMNGRRREEAREAGAGCRWQEAGPDPTGHRRGLAAEGSLDQQQLLRMKVKKMGWWGRSAASSVAA
jgi:hypothetical protein